MKIHIITTCLFFALAACSDPVEVDPILPEAVLPQINPEAEQKAFEQRELPMDPEVREF